MHYLSTLIIGGGEEEREAKLDELTSDSRFQFTHFDAREKKGIAQVRDLIKEFVFKPSIEKRSVVAIIEIQLLSRESQTTLLKMVEEPPSGFSIYITADRAENVLATIVSRCLLINLGKSAYDEAKMETFLTKPLSKQFETLDEIEIDELLIAFANKLESSHPQETAVAVIEKALAVKQKLNQAPINKKLAKEYLLVELSYL